MNRYAEDTRVPVSRSREEIYRTLERYGADERAVGEGSETIAVEFRLRGVPVQIVHAFPPRRSFPSQAGYEREVRRRWRVMVLLLKSRLELVADGAESVEQAFLAYVSLPDGSTVGDHAILEARRAREEGRMPSSVLPLALAPKVIALGSGGE